MTTQSRSEFGLGWKVLLAGFLGTMCGASPIPFNTVGFLFEPLNQEFGWTKTQISIGVTIYGVVAALLAPVFGWLSDRYGVRRVALYSVAAFIVVFSSFYFTPSSLSGFYGLWLALGLIGIGSTPVTWSRAVSMWFVQNRGLALGMMLLGTSAAGMIIPQIAKFTLAEYGWRVLFPALSLLPLLLALPVGILFFREPRPEERPAALVDEAGVVQGVSFGTAIRTRQFWLLFASILLIAFAYGGAHSHMVPMVKDHGFGLAEAANVMLVVSLGLLSGRIIVGLLLDRIWGPAVAFPVLCLPATACYLLMGTGSELSAIQLAGFFLGFAAGAESDLIAFLAARYFGMAHFGRIYGMLYLPFGLASAISPVAYGMVRDTSGSYDSMLKAAAIIFIAGAALLLLLGRYPDLSKESPYGEPAKAQ